LLAIFIALLEYAGFSLFDNLIGYQSSILLNLVVTGLIIFEVLSSYFEMYLWCMIACCENRTNYIFFKVATSSTLVLLIAGTVAFFLYRNKEYWKHLALSLGSKLMVASICYSQNCWL